MNSSRKIVVLRGLPGSGKSTYAARLVAESNGTMLRLNRDNIRNMLVGPHNRWYDFSIKDEKYESLVRHMKLSLLKDMLNSGFDVVCDDTHLKSKSVKEVLTMSKYFSCLTVEEKWIRTPLDECVKRNDKRNESCSSELTMSSEIILRMAKQFSVGSSYPEDKVHNFVSNIPVHQSEQDNSLPHAIICDLDGTLAIIGDRSPYDASECHVKDKINSPVRDVVVTFNTKNTKVIFVSARPETYRQQTQAFIDAHCLLPNSKPIHYDLYMRTAGDSRSDDIVKRELYVNNIYGKYYVNFVLDDRDSVVKLWRSLGLACFQVNYGNF